MKLQTYIKIILYYPNDQVMCEEIYKYDKYKDYDEYYDEYYSKGQNSKRFDISFMFNCMNMDMPNRTIYGVNGDILLQEWFNEDKLYHREGKPAIIEYLYGKPIFKEYWENGIMKTRIEVNG